MGWVVICDVDPVADWAVELAAGWPAGLLAKLRAGRSSGVSCGWGKSLSPVL